MNSNGFELLAQLPDSHGAPLADYHYCIDDSLLYVQWHSHLTAHEVVRGYQEGLHWHQQLRPQRLLHDNSRASGDWSEALPWLQFEWLPTVLGANLQMLCYVFSSDVTSKFISEQFLTTVRARLPIELFRNTDEALSWLCHPHAAHGVIPPSGF